jgi:hypothetical protein
VARVCVLAMSVFHTLIASSPTSEPRGMEGGSCAPAGSTGVVVEGKKTAVSKYGNGIT